MAEERPRPSDGVADALENLADGRDQRTDPIETDQPAPADVEPDAPPGAAGDVEEEAFDPAAASQSADEGYASADADAFDMGGEPAGPVRRRRTSSRPAARTRGPSQFARIAVKVCMVVGMLLFVPALWAVLQLAGVPVPRHDADGAGAMALLMLVCWPIGILLVAGAFYYSKLFARMDAQLEPAARDAVDAGEGI